MGKLKNIDIDKAIKKSKMSAGMGQSKKRRSKSNPENTSQNKNIDRIRELGEEITEMRRKKSMAVDPEEQQRIQDKIDLKREKYNELKEQGRRQREY